MNFARAGSSAAEFEHEDNPSRAGLSAEDEALKAPLGTSPPCARVGHRAQELEHEYVHQLVEQHSFRGAPTSVGGSLQTTAAPGADAIVYDISCGRPDGTMFDFDELEISAVSYTHLTLPTILLV